MERDLFAEIFNEQRAIEPDNLCNHKNVIIDGYHTCILCGIVDVHRHAFAESVLSPRPSTNLYHRKSYFREKLKLMVGTKQSLSAKYSLMVAHLRDQKFNSILELRRLMRKRGYQKYYKYIYSIYYDIKGVRLINLSYSEIENLTCKFLRLEDEFKKLYPKKSNLLSYNLVIYSLLKKYNHPCYQNIILPKNRRRLLKIIENLVK